MSNRVNIVLREIRRLKDDAKWIEAYISDDYNCDGIELLPDEIPYERDGKTVRGKALLGLLLRTQKHPDYGYQQITDIFDYVVDSKKGVNVEGVYYDWDKIQHIMQVNWVEYDAEREACRRFFGGNKIAFDIQLNSSEIEALDKLEYQILCENGLKNINGGYVTITIYELLEPEDFEDEQERLLCEVECGVQDTGGGGDSTTSHWYFNRSTRKLEEKT
jgi:hypothetical protein